jgi:hypothetical protein
MKFNIDFEKYLTAGTVYLCDFLKNCMIQEGIDLNSYNNREIAKFQLSLFIKENKEILTFERAMKNLFSRDELKYAIQIDNAYISIIRVRENKN